MANPDGAGVLAGQSQACSSPTKSHQHESGEESDQENEVLTQERSRTLSGTVGHDSDQVVRALSPCTPANRTAIVGGALKREYTQGTKHDSRNPSKQPIVSTSHRQYKRGRSPTIDMAGVDDCCRNPMKLLGVRTCHAPPGAR